MPSTRTHSLFASKVTTGTGEDSNWVPRVSRFQPATSLERPKILRGKIAGPAHTLNLRERSLILIKVR
jgi:hypothetical protein